MEIMMNDRERIGKKLADILTKICNTLGARIEIVKE